MHTHTHTCRHLHTSIQIPMHTSHPRCVCQLQRPQQRALNVFLLFFDRFFVTFLLLTVLVNYGNLGNEILLLDYGFLIDPNPHDRCALSFDMALVTLGFFFSTRTTDVPSRLARVTLHPTPYILHPTPYTPHPTPYTLHPTPYTLHSERYTPLHILEMLHGSWSKRFSLTTNCAPYMHIYMYVCMYVCMYIYIYIYIGFRV
jgi:hypothetical protein